ncbi:hypothetical protein [Bacteroides congonensis]|jgi:hypothetical protein|uniref:hypothetical protein n=2 Tax=Bacteroides congonensis TaxID=1871006 RepID=UPI0018988833|nr:hypothetical protein [Bacteroides congonensis]
MPSQKEIELYETIRPKIESIRNTIKDLSNKKPDVTLNSFKVKRVNLLLEQANGLLKDLKPYEDFSKFDEDDLPTYSDVLMILNLYVKSFEKYWQDNSETHKITDPFEFDREERIWKTNNNRKK